MTKKQKEQQQAIETLRKFIPVGTTIYTNIEHVSRSGMSRVVTVFVVEDGEIRNISGLVSDACDYGWDDRHYGVKVGGCGFDAGFDVVHNLSYALFPDSFVCIGKGDDQGRGRCPANDHSNGDRDYTPHQHSKGAAGYALHHRWM